MTRNFTLLLAATGVSAVGSRVTRTALPMTAVLLLDASPFQLGYLSVLGVLPGALVAWWAGAWIDRRSRLSVMVGADWARALLIATVPVAALSGHLTLVHLGIVAALVCMASVMFEIADHAILPVVAGREHLVVANARREAVDATAEITGPPLGGVLVQWLTAPLALAVDALSFVASAFLLGRMRVKDPAAANGSSGAAPFAASGKPRLVDERNDTIGTTNTVGSPLAAPGVVAPRPSLLGEARAGLAFVWGNPLLRALLLSTTLLTFFMSFMSSLYTLYALRTLQLSPGVLGLVIGCGGLGALAGAAMVPALARRFDPLRIAIGALAAGGVAQMFIPLAPPAPLLAATFMIVSQVAGDALLTIYLITETSLRQKAIADEALGRAAAVWKMTASIVAPAGMMLGAALAEYAGMRTALWALVGGALLATVPLVVFRRRSRR